MKPEFSIYNLRWVYNIALLISTTLLLFSCGCPGAKNLAYPQFYMAQDFMKYDLSTKCTLAKTDTATQGIHEWTGIINTQDDFIFSFTDDQLSYFRIMHHNQYEDLYQLFGKYISFFKLNGSNWRYTQSFSFKCDYRNWSVECNLIRPALRIVCTRKG